MAKIGVVIVTFNRSQSLKIALRKFDEQIHSPQYIVVVNNASTDDTAKILKEWSLTKEIYDKIVITNKANMGGSGGFYEGLKRALELDADWIWVSDDDAFPEKDTLKNLNDAIDFLKNVDPKLVAICGTVMNGGIIDVDHRRCIRKSLFRIRKIAVPESKYQEKTFKIDEFSYVGTTFSKSALQRAGITNRDYFIYYDDTEHSWRLNRIGNIYCIPSVIVHHNVGIRSDEFCWKTYYAVRNKLNLYKRFAPSRYYHALLIYQKLKNIARFIMGHKNTKIKLYWDAINDAQHDKLGKHEQYKPGWKE